MQNEIDNRDGLSIGLLNKSVFPLSLKFGSEDGLPFFSLLRNKIIFYCSNPNKSKVHKIHTNSIENLNLAHSKGLMSKPIAKKIKRMISLWASSIDTYNSNSSYILEKDKRKLTFITLTLSSKQMHSDLFIKKNLLFRFIETLQVKYNLKHYLWRAERQQNGNIHFHIIVDIFIHHSLLRYIWNDKQKQFGYLNDYIEKYGRENPNSTDVKFIKDVSIIEKYVSKYITKNESLQKIEGHVWGCSAALRNLTPYTNLLDSYLSEIVLSLNKEKKLKVYSEEYFSVLTLQDDTNLKDLNIYFKERLEFQDKQNYTYLYLTKEIPVSTPSEIISEIITLKATELVEQLSLFNFDITRSHPHYF